MAKPGLIAAAPAQLHLGHAGGGSRVWRTRIRQSQAFPDAARPRHADGVARSAPVIRRPAQRNLRHLEMIVKMTYVVRQMVDRLGKHGSQASRLGFTCPRWTAWISCGQADEGADRARG